MSREALAHPSRKSLMTAFSRPVGTARACTSARKRRRRSEAMMLSKSASAFRLTKSLNCSTVRPHT